MSNKLYVYTNDVTEWVIAYNLQDAVKVWEETMGDKYIAEEYGGEFSKRPDDEQFTLYEEKTLSPQPIPKNATKIQDTEYSHTYRASHRDWINARGRCYLGSTEY